MHRCEFPTAPQTLGKKNEMTDMKVEDNVYSFTLNNVLFKSSQENETSNVRITLTHKITGEEMHFYESKPLKFYPEIEKLKPKETNSNLGHSFAELTREFGSAKAQKQLREKEKLNINKEATKTLKDVHRDALKNEKIEAAKGNKLERLDSSFDSSICTASMSSLIDADNCIKFSTIAPQVVLESLQLEAESIIIMSYEEIEKLSGDLSFHKCILDLLKKWPKFEMKKLQLCILLEYMIRFHGLPIKKIRSKRPIEGCPEVTTEFLVMNYSKQMLVEGGKPSIQVGKDEKDKLLLMIMVLFGYLSNYEFPIHFFMIDVKVGRDKLKKLGQLLGMKITFMQREHYAQASKPFVLENL